MLAELSLKLTCRTQFYLLSVVIAVACGLPYFLCVFLIVIYFVTQENAVTQAQSIYASVLLQVRILIDTLN